MKEFKDETIRFKIISIDEKGDCKAINENGKELIVDPFVGCAFEYKNRGHLLNGWFEATGFFHKDGAFLPSEGEFKKIANPLTEGEVR